MANAQAGVDLARKWLLCGNARRPERLTGLPLRERCPAAGAFDAEPTGGERSAQGGLFIEAFSQLEQPIASRAGDRDVRDRDVRFRIEVCLDRHRPALAAEAGPPGPPALEAEAVGDVEDQQAP